MPILMRVLVDSSYLMGPTTKITVCSVRALMILLWRMSRTLREQAEEKQNYHSKLNVYEKGWWHSSHLRDLCPHEDSALVTFQRPSFLMPSHQRLRFQHMIFCGGPKSSDQSTHTFKMSNFSGTSPGPPHPAPLP